jgi:hypothetical protein
MSAAWVHAKSCLWEKCPGDCCDCDCGAACFICGSFFWFKTHPSERIREDGPIDFLEREARLCRWCWMRVGEDEVGRSLGNGVRVS